MEPTIPEFELTPFEKKELCQNAGLLLSMLAEEALRNRCRVRFVERNLLVTDGQITVLMYLPLATNVQQVNSPGGGEGKEPT